MENAVLFLCYFKCREAMGFCYLLISMDFILLIVSFLCFLIKSDIILQNKYAF